MKTKIITYAVPYKKNINSGPMVRVTAINNAFKELGMSIIIVGSGLLKFREAIKAKKSDILYIESSTNRIKLFDLFSLLILKYKSEKTIVYIRDVYVELFPEEYATFSKKITTFFNKLTNKFYASISNAFAFPTIEMSKVFFDKNHIKKRDVIELPPACDINIEPASNVISKNRLKQIKIIYIGGIGYKYSGIENFINLVQNSPDDYKFYIVTYDTTINNYLNKLSSKDNKKVTLLSMNKNEIAEFIKNKSITYMFHCRPINEYDNLTYPIKFFDSLTWNLPILTAKNLPIVKILGEDYPLYVRVEDPEHICEVISRNKPNYFKTLKNIEKIASQNRYKDRILHLFKEFKK